MNRLATLLLLLLMSFLAKSQVREGLQIPANPKIGLSLAGGGAKGFAHVGVLKVLDSLGIKVDYISGTSMGAIVGGMYASGYTGKDIEKIILETDFYTLIANEKTRQEATFFNKTNDKYLLTVPIRNGKVNVLPKAISTGQKNIYMLKELFKNVAGTEDFSKLPIPFMCVATNLESGKMEIFDKGDLVSSIMASSAFPSLMDPVKIGDSLYIDGAMTVNYPSKPLKDRGIDIVIGVDLSQGLASRENLNSVINILNQVIDMGIQKETKYQYNYTDINIHPDLTGYTATSYDDKQKILTLGETEAEKYVQILNRLPKKETQLLRMPINPVFSNVYKIDSLAVTNNGVFSDSYIRGKMGLKLPSMQTYGSINRMIDKLYATNNYSLVNYDIIQKNDSNYLKIDVQEDRTRFFLKFGLHYDEIFHTGLLLNATVKRLLFNNSTISADFIIGDSPRYYFNYFIDNGYIPGFGIFSNGMNLELKDKYSNVVDRWNWIRNEAYIQSIWKDKYAIGGGLSHDYFEKKGLTSKYTGSRNYFNPYVFIKSDTQDDKDFPTKGVFLHAEGKIIDLFNSETEKKNLMAKAKLTFNIPVSPLITYQTTLYGGFTIGQTEHPYYFYRIGGLFEQNINNFSRLDGLEFGQISAQNILTASNRLQVKVYKNFYATGSFNIANPFEEIKFEEILRVKYSTVGLTAGYKSPFGQIKLNYSTPLKGGKGMFNVILGHWF